MRVNECKAASHFLRCAMIVISLLALAPATSAQENLKKVQQGLVTTNPPVNAKNQEFYTLVTLSSGCSGSLLRNNWVITAAHCVDDPDPARKGEFIQLPDDSVTVTANWSNVQVKKSIRIITFRPDDVAIIRVDSPFVVSGSKTNFSRDIFRGEQFPYFGQLSPVPIVAFGRGINKLAYLNEDSIAIPSSKDGLFRIGYFKTQRDDGAIYWYPSIEGQHIAGGDSGGPSFATVRGTKVQPSHTQGTQSNPTENGSYSLPSFGGKEARHTSPCFGEAGLFDYE